MEPFAREPAELDEGRLLAAKLCADPRPDVIAAALAFEMQLTMARPMTSRSHLGPRDYSTATGGQAPARRS